ncbi:MAG: hypothetical protein KF838_06665 [Phycisphaeraceae bacterium]|nr:MAG: hypothetical protein KF838_06665 [Phycisphaeraceae bacterium]
MKKCVLAAASIAAIAGVASADVYNDNVGNHLGGGDLHNFFASQGFNHLDIVSVEVTNDATDLFFDIRLNADLDATSWGNYMVAMNTGAGTATDNPWGPRPINWGTTISHWVGTWANDGGSGIGGQVWSHDGSSWSLISGLSGSDDSQHAAGHQRFSVSLATLGLGVGDVVLFDVVTSGGGGGDPGIDHLSRSDYATDNWGMPSASGGFLAYTIVPAPGTAMLAGLCGMLAARRRR